MSGHTPGPITYEKCRCGHRSCDQYTLSTQRSVGFDLADAQLYAAAPDLLEALRLAIPDLEAIADEYDMEVEALTAARAAIAKATGKA